MSRPIDYVRIEREGVGSFEAFTSFDVTGDMISPSESAFEIGDDGTFDELEGFVSMGSGYQIFVNERLTSTGRVELNDTKSDLGAGTTLRLTVRTKLTDAQYTTANPNLQSKNITLKDWLVKLYAPLGYVESDFVFKANAARDLITGKTSKNGKEPPVPPDKIQEQAAKPVPPETVFAAADRHLRRFGFMHWDSPDGKIVVGEPDDSQDPIYSFRQYRGEQGVYNNVIDIGRVKDWSGIPSAVSVSGTQFDADGFSTKKTKGLAFDVDVQEKGFFRVVLINGEQMNTDAKAAAAAHRELSARSQKKDAISITTDGLSFWDGYDLINFAHDTTADIVAETMGGPIGKYYLTKFQLSRRPNDADTSSLTLLKEGVWRLR